MSRRAAGQRPPVAQCESGLVRSTVSRRGFGLPDSGRSRPAVQCVRREKAEFSSGAECCAISDILRLEGIVVGRRHVVTLMRKMGIEALYRRSNTSRRHPRHLIYPYLLRKLVIDRPNQVWATEVTYIPMARGFVYLHAYNSVAAAKAGIGNHFVFYNGRRPHTALDRNTPDNVCFESQPPALAV